jgi:integrase
MALSDSKIRAAKPKEKVYKLFDGGGLHIRVEPTGARLWRLKYRFGGHEKLLSMGIYPDVPLASARKRRDEARALLAEDPPIDPAAERAAAKLATVNTFAAVAEEFIGKQVDRLALRTVDKARWQLREFVNPYIGDMPINEISAQNLLAALRRIEHRGKIETAHKTKELCGRVFLYAIATGRCDHNVAADLKLALKPRPAEHLAAITDPPKVGKLLRAIDGYDGQPATAAALRLAPHVFLRPGELRHGRWAEIEWGAALWRVPADRMKMKREHVVPLSVQSISILTWLKEITGRGEYMFPAIGPKSRPISENTLGAALRGLGYSSDVHTPHGFRSMASTLLHELGFVSTDIELQLAHADKNKIRAVYNRSERIKERTRMMQAWSNYLDSLRDVGNVVAIRRRKR